jgi:hypothetical protein
MATDTTTTDATTADATAAADQTTAPTASAPGTDNAKDTAPESTPTVTPAEDAAKAADATDQQVMATTAAASLDATVVTETPSQTVEPVLNTRPEGATIVDGTVPAQVVQPPRDAPATIDVKEGTFHSDVVITDTSDPLAVQVLPSDDRSLPSLGNRETPEEQFKNKA